MPSRLSTIAPDLAAWLEHQSRERLRAAAANAAHLAVERTRLTDPRLDAARLHSATASPDAWLSSRECSSSWTNSTRPLGISRRRSKSA